MPPKLPQGTIVTIAPDYSRRRINGMQVPPLPKAAKESEMLVDEFDAKSLTGGAKEVMQLLEGRLDHPVAILHFAGHGEFGTETAATSQIFLSDEDICVLEIRNEEIKLGRKYGTLVVFNACQVGATGSVLGSIGGWAEVFLRGGFSGFIGPLWSVNDDDACTVMREFFDEVVHRKHPAAQALQWIRKTYGHQSPTFLSYLYYGDVMARIES